MQNITIQLPVKDAEILCQSLKNAGRRLIRSAQRDLKVLEEYVAADADPSVRSAHFETKNSGEVALNLGSAIGQILKSGKPIALMSIGSMGPRVDKYITDELPYTGKYPQYYNCVLKLTAKRVDRGWMEKTHKQPEES